MLYLYNTSLLFELKQFLNSMDPLSQKMKVPILSFACHWMIYNQTTKIRWCIPPVEDSMALNRFAKKSIRFQWPQPTRLILVSLKSTNSYAKRSVHKAMQAVNCNKTWYYSYSRAVEPKVVLNSLLSVKGSFPHSTSDSRGSITWTLPLVSPNAIRLGSNGWAAMTRG